MFRDFDEVQSTTECEESDLIFQSDSETGKKGADAMPCRVGVGCGGNGRLLHLIFVSFISFCISIMKQSILFYLICPSKPLPILITMSSLIQICSLNNLLYSAIAYQSDDTDNNITI